MAYSPPAPPVQPTRALEKPLLSINGASSPISCEKLSRPTARPPVAYMSQSCTAQPMRGRAVNSQPAEIFDIDFAAENPIAGLIIVAGLQTGGRTTGFE